VLLISYVYPQSDQRFCSSALFALAHRQTSIRINVSATPSRHLIERIPYLSGKSKKYDARIVGFNIEWENEGLRFRRWHRLLRLRRLARVYLRKEPDVTIVLVARGRSVNPAN